MTLTASKTQCDGTGHLPGSAWVTDHLEAAQLPGYPFCKKVIDLHVTQADWPWDTAPSPPSDSPLRNGAIQECCGTK